MKNLRKRKMLLVLPLLVIPFLTMAFWALGGGRGKTNKALAMDKGLNLDLPDANLKEDVKLLDKLGFYDKADKDSIKMEEWMRSDPYYKAEQEPGDTIPFAFEQIAQNNASKFNQQLKASPYQTNTNNPEHKIMEKLALLEKEMNKAAPEYKEPIVKDRYDYEADRLENMMQQMNTANEEDPEMQQLNGTLDKILDIQHPQRIKERLKEKSVHNKEQGLLVSTQSESDTLVPGFFGLHDEEINDTQNAIEAVVHETQTLVNGAVIKLRLLNDIYINGSLIAKDNFLFGFASLNNERLEVEIRSIRYDQSLYSVKLEVYDMDGLRGIYIPGAISRDVAKQSADNSLQLMDLSSMDPSLKAQAASAGAGAAKNLLSKKVKLIKVMVKAGYKVLLKDKNVQQ